MSDAGSSNPRAFQLVDNESEALSFLKEGAATSASSMIWTKNQECVVNTMMVLFSEVDTGIFFIVPKGFDPKNFMASLAKTGENDCFFSMSLARANIFFKAAFIGFEKKYMHFDIPTKIYKVQRRNDLRFVFPQNYEMEVQFEDPTAPNNVLTKKIIDLSAGGMALHIEEADHGLYQPGVMLKSMTFIIRGRQIICDGEIRHVAFNSHGGRRVSGAKIGVLFHKLKAGETQHIAQFIFDESRRYFSNFFTTNFPGGGKDEK
ncbi:PilZ domain-containing protein [bacterium]|nr:PilZ domain-containing protein [bacterium]